MAMTNKAPREWMVEEEIDLRQYVEVLLKYKFWIIGLAALAAVVAFVLGSRGPDVYRAEASLAMLSVRSEVVLEPNYKTLSDDELQPRTDVKTRRETLATLARSSVVAAAVLEQMGERLNGVVTNVEALRAKVSVQNQGDLILVRASARDAGLAADIANAWAEQAVIYINGIYGQPSQQVQELEVQLSDVWTRYQTAQSKLEAFLAESPIPGLEQQILQRQNLIEAYQQTLTDGEVTAHSQALENDLEILSDCYAELARIEQVLVDAQALQMQLQSGKSTPAAAWAEALAFIGVQNRAFGAQMQGLEVVLDGEAPSVGSQDLERLITVLEGKAQGVQEAIVQKEQALFGVETTLVSVASDSPLSQRIESLTQEMMSLLAQLEAVQARERELTKARDLAWETYETVARKMAEAEVAEQVTGSEVRLAAPAFVPTRPVGRGRLTSTLVAGMLGGMIGVFGAFVVDWWRQSVPDVSPEAEESVSEEWNGPHYK